jgi:outer membrane protein OmpA-like peptidoglycan-associated protein
MKKRNISILLIFLLAGVAVQAQPYYGWRLGAGLSGAAYYGDLSYRLKTAKISWPSYQVLLGRSLSPSLDVELNASWGRFSASDRATDWRGNLRTDNPNFDRDLNFQTRYRTASLLLQYKFNNGYWLSQYARFGPYLFAGGGITDFAVYGDLQHDGDFETKLSTKERGASYPTSVLTVPFGAGVKWRISDRLSADARAGASYAFSDYLDNIKAGKRNDVYFTAGVSLQYHFELGGDKFRAPLVYVGSDTPPTAQLAISGNPSGLDSIGRINPDLNVTMPGSNSAQNLPDAFVRGQQHVQPVTAPEPYSNTGQAIQGEEWDTLQTRNRLVGVDTTTQVDPVSVQMRTKPVNVPAYRTDNGTDSSYVAAEKTGVGDAPVGNTSSIAGRSQSQLAADGQRRTDRYGMSNGNTQTNENTGANEARVQRLELQVADLNRQLEALRTEQQPPVDRLSQGNNQDAVRLRNDANDLNRRIREVPRNSVDHRPVYLSQDRKQTAGELNAITAQLNTLKKGQSQLLADQSSEKKLDSLLNQVSALSAQLDTAQAVQPNDLASGQEGVIAAGNTAVGNDNSDRFTENDNQALVNPDSTRYAGAAAAATSDTALHSVQDQLAALRRSVDELQEQLMAANAGPTLRKRLPYGPLVIYYPVNSDAIGSEDKQRLAVIARRLGTDSLAVVQVKGFTDQTGNAAYNLALSRKRAERIRNYLVTSLGVEPGRVIVNYFGQAQATDQQENPYDRRVELELYSVGK